MSAGNQERIWVQGTRNVYGYREPGTYMGTGNKERLRVQGTRNVYGYREPLMY